MARNARVALGALALSMVLAVSVWAADATGKWTWTQRRQNNDVTMTLELKQDGEKLTGFVIGGQNAQKTEIKEGKVGKDGVLSFVVVRERNGQEFKVAYSGKVDGDNIVGETKMTIQGEERKREWKATRAK